MTATDLEAFLSRLQFPLFFGLLAVFILLERLIPHRAGPGEPLKHDLRNTALFVLGTVTFSGVLNAVALRLSAGSHPYGLFDRLHLPYAARAVLGFLVLDCAMYWRHRLAHRVPLLWRMHRVHHSDPAVDATTLFRLHPVEMITVSVVYIATVVVFGVPSVAVVLTTVLSGPTAMLQHGNIRLPEWLDRALSWVLISPHQHRVHHSPYVDETDSNFGAILSIWDHLFGTTRIYAQEPEFPFGLFEYHGAEHQTLKAMLLNPLRNDPAILLQSGRAPQKAGTESVPG